MQYKFSKVELTIEPDQGNVVYRPKPTRRVVWLYGKIGETAPYPHVTSAEWAVGLGYTFFNSALSLVEAANLCNERLFRPDLAKDERPQVDCLGIDIYDDYLALVHSANFAIRTSANNRDYHQLSDEEAAERPISLGRNSSLQIAERELAKPKYLDFNYLDTTVEHPQSVHGSYFFS